MVAAQTASAWRSRWSILLATTFLGAGLSWIDTSPTRDPLEFGAAVFMLIEGLVQLRRSARLGPDATKTAELRPGQSGITPVDDDVTVWDEERDELFTWHHTRDGRCAAEIQDDGGRYGAAEVYRCPEPVVGVGWWFYSWPAPGHWVALNGCGHHLAMMTARP